MNYIEQKIGPMCSVGMTDNKYTLKMLVGGTKETFIEISKEEFEEFPRWTGKTYDSILQRLLKASE